MNAALEAQVMRDLAGVNCSVGLSAKLRLATAELTDTGRLQTAVAALAEPGVAELAAQIGETSRLESVLKTPATELHLDSDVSRLPQLLVALDDHLGRLQQTATVRLTERVLKDQGYTVQWEAGEVASGLEAHRGDETFVVAVMDHGEMLVDQLGAGDCAGNLDSFVDGLQQAGAVVTRVSEVEHDPDDAPLIAQAAACGTESLAAGIARNGTRRRDVKQSRATATREATVDVVVRVGEAQR